MAFSYCLLLCITAAMAAQENLIENREPYNEERQSSRSQPTDVNSQDEASGDLIPEDCKKYGICENVPDYPQELADKIITELGDKVEYLATDMIHDVDVVQRAGSPFNNTPLCESFKKNYIPNGLVKDQTFHYVVNNPFKPIQVFQTETCRNPDEMCDNIACFREGYEGYCVQQYVDRKVMIMVGSETEFTSTPIPSCCTCVARIL